MRARHPITWLTLVGVALSCGGDPAAPEDDGGNDVGAPATIRVTSGGSQAGPVAEPLSRPIVVQVQDAQGRPVPDVDVTFGASGTFASADPETARTDATGSASTTWTLGIRAGQQLLQARVGTSLSVDVTAAANPGPAAEIVVESGSGQVGTREAELLEPVVVLVRDAYDNLKRGAPVTFEASDGGSVAPESTTTDFDGLLSARWTLGLPLGPQTLTATAGAGLSAEATADATAALTLLDHVALDAVLDPTRDRIVTVSADPDRLNVVDPSTGAVTSLELDLNPTAVSVQPDGAYAAVGHDGFITYVDLEALTIVDVYGVSCDVVDLVLPGNGWVYAFPRTDQWETIRSVELATGDETRTGTIRAGTLVRLHPSGDFIYGADNGLSPSDIEKYDITAGAAAYLYDSPYHGDFGFWGNLWIYEDGSRIIARSGNVFRSSSVQGQDMLYAGSLDESNTITSAAQSTELERIVLVGRDAFRREGGTTLRSYTDSFFDFRGELALPHYAEVSGSSVETFASEGRFVLIDAAGSSVYVLVRGLDPFVGRFLTGLVVFDAADVP